MPESDYLHTALSASRDLGRELSHRFSFPGNFRQDLRPARLVKRCRRSELPERNRLQRVDAVEQEDADSRNIARHLCDTFQKLEPDPLTTRCDLPRDERAHYTQGQPSLGDPGIVALLGQQVQVLDTAIEDIHGMNDSQATDIRNVDLNGTPGKILGSQPGDAREEIHLLYVATLGAMSNLAGLRARVIQRRYPRLPPETFTKGSRKRGIADEIGVGCHSRAQTLRTLDPQMIGPESQRLSADQQSLGRADTEYRPDILGIQRRLGTPTPRRSH